ncbi:MAG: hypothetical protein HDQ87_11955 [Clostridia bacterium]|nr:hypothetical protein [Clostridia bacterium]
MFKFRQILDVAAYNFRQWRYSPRVIIVFALAFVLCFLLSDKAVRFAEHYGTVLQIGEPFVWTFGDATNILLISLLLVLLFADMPFVTPGTPFYLTRTTRTVWLLGQIIYICVATTIFVAFILLATSALCAHISFAGNQWSETAAILGYSGTGLVVSLPASVKTMQMSSPYACMSAIYVLILLYALLMVSVMLVFNLWRGQFWGIFSTFIFSLFGLLLNPEVFISMFELQPEQSYRARVAVGWLSPLNHATYYMHNFGYDLLPRLEDTYLIFLAAIAVMFGTALHTMRSYNFEFTGTER